MTGQIIARFNALVRNELVNSRLGNLASKSCRLNSIVWCESVKDAVQWVELIWPQH